LLQNAEQHYSCALCTSYLWTRKHWYLCKPTRNCTKILKAFQNSFSKGHKCTLASLQPTRLSLSQADDVDWIFMRGLSNHPERQPLNEYLKMPAHRVSLRKSWVHRQSVWYLQPLRTWTRHYGVERDIGHAKRSWNGCKLCKCWIQLLKRQITIFLS